MSPHFKVDASGLYIPVIDSSKGEPKFKCTVIVSSEGGENKLCGTPFWDTGSYERHVARCSAEHMGEIRKAAPSQRMPAFYGPESGIPDVEKWLNDEDAGGVSNRAKVIAGRKKM